MGWRVGRTSRNGKTDLGPARCDRIRLIREGYCTGTVSVCVLLYSRSLQGVSASRDVEKNPTIGAIIV